MGFLFLAFCPVTTPCKGEAVTFWCDSQVLAHRKKRSGECVNVSVNGIFVFGFLSCDYPLQRGGCHILVTAKSGYKKKKKIEKYENNFEF